MSQIVFTTQSGAGVLVDLVTEERYDQYVDDYPMEHEPHCYVCHRHTDHFAEHDSLVGLGLASYSDNGDVHVTDFARTIMGEQVRAEYDYAIRRSLRMRGGVCLIKPEGYARTYAMQHGITIPG